MNRHTLSLFAASGLALFGLVTGCRTPEPAQSPADPVLPDPGADEEYKVEFPDPGHGAARYIRLGLGDDISKTCGLVRANFHFDSASLPPGRAEALRDVVDCLNHPQLKDTPIEIAGRADSRGDTAYNVELGRKRAESVRKVLIDAGISEDRITVVSHGESDAVGSEAGMYSYGYDRRVDVLVNRGVHAPRTIQPRLELRRR